MQPYCYEVIKAASIRRIEEQVNEKLAAGFILAGGVSVVGVTTISEDEDSEITYCQAVYRERAWPQP